MTGFESIKDQRLPTRLLTTFLRKGLIPHAMLFTGQEGIGKKSMARLFAMACNCQTISGDSLPDRGKPAAMPQHACLHCSSCRKIAAHTHPDIIWVKPQQEIIRISQVRELNQNLALKPYEARFRVVIMSEAQCLNSEAANAFLKMLEEPPANTLLILTADRASNLLPTIVSRCQRIRFNPLSTGSLAAMMVEKIGGDYKAAAILAEASGGSFTKALSMAKNDHWLNVRNWLIVQIEDIAARPAEQILAAAARLSQKKEAVFDMLAILVSWLRDIAIYRFAPDKIINKDLTEKIDRLSKKNSLSLLVDQIDAIQKAQQKLGANTSLRLTLEGLMLKLSALAV